ncbi:MAG: fused MFS/spermidine synthase [Nanoarchaeota archaeon]|nr:fused MFS/spermidine synthase [Nanoarchaeota archaeon]
MNLRKVLLVAFVLSGIAALIYEIAWTRPLQIIFGSTIYSLSMILAAFMIGLSLGSYLASLYADKIKNLPLSYALIEIGIGIYAVLLIIIFNKLPSIYTLLHNSFHTQFYIFSFIQFVLVFFVLLVPTTLMGFSFPLVVKFYTGERIGKGVGTVYSANTFGAIIGSFSAGFILIPLFGVRYSIIFAGMVNVLVGCIILFIASKSLAKKIIPAVAVLFLFISVVGNYNIGRLTIGSFYYTYLSEEDIKDSEILFYKDSLYGTVTVLNFEGAKSLLINGKGEGSTAFRDIRTNYLLAYFPLLLHKNPETGLNIGLGTGTTSGVLNKFTKTETIEIDPAIVEASKQFKDFNKDVLSQPHHSLVIADARNHLLINPKKYDIITSEPADPWQSTSTNLYSKEFYEIVREHLNENGLFAQWVPIYEFSVKDFRIFYNTFQSVFPHVIAFGNARDEIIDNYKVPTTEIILIGSNEEIKLDWDEISQKIENSEIKSDFEFIKIKDLDALKNLFYFTDEGMEGYGAEAPMVTDNKPVLEFSSARTIIHGRDPAKVVGDIEGYLKEKDG